MYHDRLNLTVVSLATSPGSTIGIIRISGVLSFKIASLFTGKTEFSHMKASLCKVLSSDSSVLDKCILLPFFSPKSFTGEDLVELHVHGSQANANDIVNLAVYYGAKPALKGEFTFRAVLNGKMDLQKAFSLNTLITSSNPVGTELSRKASFENRLLSKFNQSVETWEKNYTLSTAIIDFPEQVRSELPAQKIQSDCKQLLSYLKKLIDDTNRFRSFLDFKILILGKPNVGKSSLFNTLLNQDRAIISKEKGTTRDYLTESILINRLPVKLIDSAGLRDSDSNIERSGIKKAQNLISVADLLLVIFDASQKLNKNDIKILDKTRMKPRILVKNKCDIPRVRQPILKNAVSISCKTLEGLEDLYKSIEKYMLLKKPNINDSVFFSDWQLQTALDTKNTLELLYDTLKTDQIEIISYCIKNVYNNIRSLSGDLSSINLYDKVFGSFCLGK